MKPVRKKNSAKLLLDITSLAQDDCVKALLAAFVDGGLPLPVLYVNPARRSTAKRFLSKRFPKVRWRFEWFQDDYADILRVLGEGARLSKNKNGGLYVRFLRGVLSCLSRIAIRLIAIPHARAVKKSPIGRKYSAYVAPFCPMDSVAVRSGIPCISIVSLGRAGRLEHQLKAPTRVVLGPDANEREVLAFCPLLKSENVFRMAGRQASLPEWAAAAAAAIADGPERLARHRVDVESDASYYVNNWHDAAPRTDVARVLLVGDASVMRLRAAISDRCNVPVDGFGTSMPMSSGGIARELYGFVSGHSYSYRKAVLIVGDLLSGNLPADAARLRELQSVVGCECMLASSLPGHMQENKNVGAEAEAEVQRRRKYMWRLVRRLKWRFVDVLQYTMEKTHTEESVLYCRGLSCVGATDEFRQPGEVKDREVVDGARDILAVAMDIVSDEGDKMLDVCRRMLREGRISAKEAKLEFDEWESNTVRNADHSKYLFVGGTLLRDFCAASRKSPDGPSFEVCSSSHSIADPDYVSGLRRIVEGKSYDTAFFSFGEHFFLHSEEEFVSAYANILKVLLAHSGRVVLLTSPEMVSTCDADKYECAFKNEKIRWANGLVLNEYSKKHPVMDLKAIMSKYAAKRVGNLGFDRSVYDEAFKYALAAVGETAV